MPHPAASVAARRIKHRFGYYFERCIFYFPLFHNSGSSAATRGNGAVLQYCSVHCQSAATCPCRARRRPDIDNVFGAVATGCLSRSGAFGAKAFVPNYSGNLSERVFIQSGTASIPWLTGNMEHSAQIRLLQCVDLLTCNQLERPGFSHPSSPVCL